MAMEKQSRADKEKLEAVRWVNVQLLCLRGVCFACCNLLTCVQVKREQEAAIRAATQSAARDRAQMQARIDDMVAEQDRKVKCKACGA